MSFFSRAITDISTADLAELLKDGAVENVRLEFKSQPPGSDDTLKKLSGFANTFGGYLLVGASASSSDGRLTDYPGVEPQRNYRQTIIQRCYEGVWPPFEVFVSDGILAPSAAGGRVCYVVYVPESWEAPHFLTKRRGAWIRTDEFSQRFDTRLATFEEIQHLTNRRRLAVERYENLCKRSVGRFESFAAREHSNHTNATGSIGATLCLSLCPQFPTRRLVGEHQLLKVINSERIPWRNTGFPLGRETVTQQESVLVMHPTLDFSLMEANIWGQLTYSCEIEDVIGRERRQIAGIHLHTLLGYILVFLEHARTIYRNIGFIGPLLLRTLLKRVQGKPFVHFPRGNHPMPGPASRIDDEISFDISFSATKLDQQRDEIAGDLLKTLLFSLNWPTQGGNSSAITGLLDDAANYNFWKQRS